MRPFRLLAFCLVLASCTEPYRVGEYVLVEWDGRDYPAYIVQRKDKTRYRVHFEGYDERWDEEVVIDKIKGRIEGPVKVPPPPDRVARALGIVPKPSASAGAPAPYKEGDRIRVRWRGSVYSATVQTVMGPDKFVVHYDGYGSEWDEPVSLERIVGRR